MVWIFPAATEKCRSDPVTCLLVRMEANERATRSRTKAVRLTFIRPDEARPPAAPMRFPPPEFRTAAIAAARRSGGSEYRRARGAQIIRPPLRYAPAGTAACRPQS